MVIPEGDKKPSSSDYRAANTKIKGDDLQVCLLPAVQRHTNDCSMYTVIIYVDSSHDICS
jgi:hypothetical protein